MRVLGIINKDSAVAYHRITLPLLLMEDVDVHITNHITEETFESGFDLVFYSRHLSDFAFDKINKMREKHGFKLVIDVDDFWHLDKWHPLYQSYIKEDYHTQQIKNMANADAVFVTHERLHREASQFNDNTYIIPNAIPKVEQYAETKTMPSDKVRLFWQGSATHEEDINLIKYAIENLGNTERDKIEMIMCGYHPEELVWQRMAKTYTLNKRLQHRVFKAMTYSTYYKAYSEADVCLVPLVNSRFNSMKSNLKILEAACLSLPVIAHNVNPYKDMPVTYANGTMEWVKAMKWYINNPQARIEDGQRLNEFCDTYYNHRSINQVRKEIFNETREQANIRCA